MPKLAARTFYLLALLIVIVCQSQLAFGEAWRENPEWFGRDTALSTGLRVGEVVQHVEYKSFFSRHIVVKCFEGVEGFAISLGWSEISIDGSHPVLYSVDGRESGVVPKLAYSDEHYVLMPVEGVQSTEIVAAFVRGLEVAFWTKDWANVEYEHPYSLKGFTKALDDACQWHPSLAAAKEAAKKIVY